MSTHGALVIFGSGPGIGRTAASAFASHGFRSIVLLSRNTQRLAEDVAVVRKAAAAAAAGDGSEEAVHVEALAIDLADPAIVRGTLTKLEKVLEGKTLEVVLYNAARVGPSKWMEWSAVDLETDLRIAAVSMLIVAQWALPLMAKAASAGSFHPTFLVTSGGLHNDPFPSYFSLAAGKAAQYNLTHSLHKEFGPQGVHVAAVVVAGIVSDDAKVTTARHIAEEMYQLYEQEAPGDLEVVLEDPDYLDFIAKNS